MDSQATPAFCDGQLSERSSAGLTVQFAGLGSRSCLELRSAKVIVMLRDSDIR
tara:strand:- start:353 stop:511 length:159 start_codon:yes stop_codon:yes gene_type:complete